MTPGNSRPGRAPRVALVTCVRNEAAWLPAFLDYHHAVGVERAYVFCDRCTDASESIARAYSWVQVIRMDSEQAALLPYVADLHRACMKESLTRARAEGFDWLMILDVDEYASGDNPAGTPLERAHLLPMLERVKPETVQVRLPTWEVVPERLPSGAPFWRHRFFQTRPRLTWTIFDPIRDQRHAWGDFLGHRQGKNLVRTSADVQGFDSHRWVPAQNAYWPDRPEFVELPTEEMGSHRHFYVTSQRHWLEKFAKQAFEPDTWICGTEVELPKRCWRHAAPRLNPAESEDYFDRWIARSENELLQLAEQGHVVEDASVEAVLRTTGLSLETPLFDPLNALRDRCAPRAFGWPAAKIPTDQRKGFHSIERSGSDYFRWTEPNAAVHVGAPPGDYRLRLDMKNLSHFWGGRLDLRFSDRPVPCRDRSWNDGILSQTIRRTDMPARDEAWLEMEFEPIDTQGWPHERRQLGAPIFSVFLDRLA